MRLSKEDYVSRITTASPLGIVIINYELVIQNIEDALDNADNTELFEKYAKKAQDFLAELILSLDMSYEISSNLMTIYIYVNGIFVEALRTKTSGSLSDAKDILSALLESWRSIEDKEENSAPVFTNAQKVYSGLTYGRNGANETYGEGDDKRGYTV